MSSLTSQQINDTYKGLIKLEDATTGLTSTFQYIQDGLGNNLPLQVKEGQIQGQNIFSFGYFVPDYEGPGFTVTPVQMPSGSQNLLNAVPFYNPGLNAYSAFTYAVITATSTSDSAEIAFYTSQYVPGLGYQPKDLVMSGVSLTTNSTGTKTTALPSTLSFSALGSGIYFMVQKISNSGVQPTVRFASTPANWAAGWSQQLGVQFNAAGTGISTITKQSGTLIGQPALIYTSLANFQTSFAPGDFSGGIQNVTYNGNGFVLNVIK
jgi:hypothetical protein